MSRQIRSLHRSNSHPANLQTQIPIIPLFAFPPSDSPQSNTSSGINSDTNSDISVFHTVSQFNNSVVETPDEFADSEPSPSTYTQTTSSIFFKTPLSTHSDPKPVSIPLHPSHISQITPTYSPFQQKLIRYVQSSPDNIKISEELDNFTNLQQQLPSCNTPTLSLFTIIVNSNTIKSANNYTTIRIYTITSSIIHVNRNIH